jgi:hypothetical protein
MAHVQAKHICPRLEQGADHFVITGSGAQSGHDLYVPKASHAIILFVVFKLSVGHAPYGAILPQGQLAHLEKTE